MTTAREEAERRYPFPGRNAFVSELIAAREAFISGAQWQAKQPVEITDEMVERAALAGLNAERHRHGLDVQSTLDSFDAQTRQEWREDARAALEAALGGEA